MRKFVKFGPRREGKPAPKADAEIPPKFEDHMPVDDDFQIIKEIGKGGFGSIFLIEHIPSGAQFAGKMINKEDLTPQKEESLLKEIDLLKRVNSPYTVNFFGNVTYYGRPMIIMEYMDRGSIRDIMDYKKIRLSEKQAAIVVHDVLISLAILRTKNIMHRDIKAANILINSKGQIKLTDFGVSSDFNNQDQGGTCASNGTPYWMAPEVVLGQNQTFPADIWSVGCTATELVEGVPPYSCYDPQKAMIRIIRNGFPGFRNPKLLSPEFKNFVSKCVNKNPKKRWNCLQLLSHPWIKQIENCNREEILKPITESQIDLNKLLEMNRNLSCSAFSLGRNTTPRITR